MSERATIELRVLHAGLMYSTSLKLIYWKMVWNFSWTTESEDALIPDTILQSNCLKDVVIKFLLASINPGRILSKNLPFLWNHTDLVKICWFQPLWHPILTLQYIELHCNQSFLYLESQRIFKRFPWAADKECLEPCRKTKIQSSLEN